MNIGIDEQKLDATLDAIRNAADKINGSIDQAEVRGLIVAANQAVANISQAAWNLVEVTEKLKGLLK